MDWLKINKLSLYHKKTHFMIFRNARKKLHLENELFSNNIKIKGKTCTNHLGVLADQHLTFQEHCKFIKGKIAWGIGILYKGKKNILIRNHYWICIMHSYTPTLCIALPYRVILFHIFLTRLWNYKKGLYALLMQWANHTAQIFEKYQLLNLRNLYIYMYKLCTNIPL